MHGSLEKRQRAVKSGREPLASTSAGEAFDELLHKFVLLNKVLSTAGEALAAAGRQTHARRMVLQEVRDKAVTVAQIANRLRLKRQSVQRVADLLVRDGLAVYEDNPHHRRAKLLQLTPEGYIALSKIETAHRTWADTLGAEIGESKLRRASATLDTVLDAVEHSSGA
jgi:DNA-binding MarR family transcriptional regulator